MKHNIKINITIKKSTFRLSVSRLEEENIIQLVPHYKENHFTFPYLETVTNSLWNILIYLYWSDTPSTLSYRAPLVYTLSHCASLFPLYLQSTYCLVYHSVPFLAFLSKNFSVDSLFLPYDIHGQTILTVLLLFWCIILKRNDSEH